MLKFLRTQNSKFLASESHHYENEKANDRLGENIHTVHKEDSHPEYTKNSSSSIIKRQIT